MSALNHFNACYCTPSKNLYIHIFGHFRFTHCIIIAACCKVGGTVYFLSFFFFERLWCFSYVAVCSEVGFMSHIVSLNCKKTPLKLFSCSSQDRDWFWNVKTEDVSHCSVTTETLEKKLSGAEINIVTTAHGTIFLVQRDVLYDTSFHFWMLEQRLLVENIWFILYL